MSSLSPKQIIAKRVGEELKDGDVVNLGIGLPTMVANYVPENVDVTFHSENGFLGLGETPKEGMEDPELINAGGQPTTIKLGGMLFDSAYSFAIIRGGHLDMTVLGALQVDQEGNVANWMIPGKMVPGMGGAMDLVTGAKKVIIAMMHTAKGTPKILKKCNLPLTGAKVVSMVVTEMCVFKVTEEGLLLTEINDPYTIEDIKNGTDAEFTISENLITRRYE